MPDRTHKEKQTINFYATNTYVHTLCRHRKKWADLSPFSSKGKTSSGWPFFLGLAKNEIPLEEETIEVSLQTEIHKPMDPRKRDLKPCYYSEPGISGKDHPQEKPLSLNSTQLAEFRLRKSVGSPKTSAMPKKEQWIQCPKNPSKSTEPTDPANNRRNNSRPRERTDDPPIPEAINRRRMKLSPVRCMTYKDRLTNETLRLSLSNETNPTFLLYESLSTFGTKYKSTKLTTAPHMRVLHNWTCSQYWNNTTPLSKVVASYGVFVLGFLLGAWYYFGIWSVNLTVALMKECHVTCSVSPPSAKSSGKPGKSIQKLLHPKSNLTEERWRKR